MTEQRELLLRALREVRELREKLAEAPRDAHEPIAVIGLGCRFPGADSPAALWRLLDDGIDATSEVPPDRWDVDAFHDPDPHAAGMMVTRRGGFIRDPAGFDERFFNISSREVRSLDPQQRVLLEVSWEALEHGGVAPDRLASTRTGLWFGMSNTDYAHLLTASTPLPELDAYFGTGTAFSFGPGRLAYLLGTRGPAIALDTACSSSLVAVHLACRSLVTGESDLALAGGVSLALTPAANVLLSRAQVLSPEGRCKTFDAAADGYGRGEGAGVVVLRRLSDALAARDRVLAVIRGSAVNHDGPSSGLTVPNGAAQQAVIRDALAAARVEAADVDYVEAHGTATPLGDPIEVRALGAVLGAGRPPDRPLLLGSIKTNIGHLEAGAGVAGLLKAVLALHHGVIPAHLHFRTPNPNIDWARLPVRVAAVRQPWPVRPDSGRPLCGVSSFGASGTNAHVVVEAAPPVQAVSRVDASPELLVLSAKTEDALRALADRWEHALADGTPLADACYTAATARAHLPHRLAIVADTADHARARLEAYARGEGQGDVVRGDPPRIAFLFTGEGSEYVGMGRRLFEAEPVFRRALQECDALARPHRSRPLLSVLHADDGERRIEDTDDPQPALFAIGWALAVLWRSWGIEPHAVLGHGVGEITAACVAGVLELPDAIRLVTARARLDDLDRVAEPLIHAAPRLSWVSTVTGELVTAVDATHWRRHVVEPVRFADAVAALARLGCRHLVEVGPKPILLAEARHCRPEGEVVSLPSLRDGRDDRAQMIDSLAKLHGAGARIDWDRFYLGRGLRKLALPTYPFQRRRHWVDGAAAVAASRRPAARSPSLLGVRLSSPVLTDVVFESELVAARAPMLRDHRVFGHIVVSGVVHMAMVTAALEESGSRSTGVLRCADVQFSAPLVLAEHEARVVQTILTPAEDTEAAFQLVSRDHGGGWTVHTRGRIGVGQGQDGPPRPPARDLAAIRERCAETRDGLDFYERLLGGDEHWIGPSFRTIERLWRRDGEALAELSLPPDDVLRPPGCDLELAFVRATTIGEVYGQALMPAVPDYDRIAREHGDTFIGHGMDLSVQHVRDVSHARYCHAVLTTGMSGDDFVGELALLDDAGEVLAEVHGLRIHRVGPASIEHALAVGTPRVARSPVSRAQLVAGGPDRVRAYLCDRVAEVLSVEPGSLRPSDSLRELGVDSLMVIELRDAVADDLDVALPLADSVGGATLESLAAWLHGALAPARAVAGSPAQAGDTPWIRRLQVAAAPRLRVYGFPHGGAGAMAFRGWIDHLPAEVELCGIQLPGREDRLHETPIERLDDVVDAVADALIPALASSPSPPWALFGVSMGALVAYRVAHALRRRGAPAPAHLLVAAAPAPHVRSPLDDFIPAVLAALDGPPAARTEALRRFGLLPDALLDSPEMLDLLLPALRADLAVVLDHEHRSEPPLSIPITAFGAVADPLVDEALLRSWAEHTDAGFQLELIPGSAHLFYQSEAATLVPAVLRALEGPLDAPGP